MGPCGSWRAAAASTELQPGRERASRITRPGARPGGVRAPRGRARSRRRRALRAARRAWRCALSRSILRAMRRAGCALALAGRGRTRAALSIVRRAPRRGVLRAVTRAPLRTPTPLLLKAGVFDDRWARETSKELDFEQNQSRRRANDGAFFFIFSSRSFLAFHARLPSFPARSPRVRHQRVRLTDRQSGGVVRCMGAEIRVACVSRGERGGRTRIPSSRARSHRAAAGRARRRWGALIGVYFFHRA
jgi:hypothetical protein